MAEIPDDLKRVLFESKPKRCVWVSAFWTYVGVACMIVGIVSDAINMKLGLISTNWFILAVGLWMMAIFTWFTAYISAKEK
jgi:hypothetical protein